MKAKGKQIETVVEAVEHIAAGQYLFHGSHLFPAGKIRNWTIRKLTEVVKAGNLFVSAHQYDA